MTEVGTLKELDVKPGGVVEYWYSNRTWVKGRIDENCVARMENGLEQDKKNSTHPNWRIVTRAAPSPKLWRDMTDAEKGALLLAHHEGKVIEWKCGDTCFGMKPSWVDDIAYRVRPEPKVEVVRQGYKSNAKGQFVTTHSVDYATHVVTFNTIDGKPDTASIKMEVI